ncbi:MAG: SEC-C domain-containing protein [Bacteroides sp.]|jgi:hypothetical protein|nr:SEC-C domain-containing protein [Bacteroides sp.]
MIDFDSNNFCSSIKLVDGFRMNTKNELTDFAKLLNVPVSAKLRKDEYITALAQGVLSTPESWLSCLTYYELTLLQKLVHAGPDAYVEEQDFLVESVMEYLSLVLVDRWFSIDEGKARYMICDELRESIAPHLDKVLSVGEQTSYFLIEQHAHGLLNLYGFLRYSDLIDMLCEYLSDLLPKTVIIDVMSSSMLIQHNLFEMIGESDMSLYVKSPVLMEPERLEDDLYQHRKIRKMKHFPKEEVFAMGKMPRFDIPNIHSGELKRYIIEHLGLSEDMAVLRMQDIWYSMQMDMSPISIATSMVRDKLSSMQELEEAIELFIAYCNECPRWFLKGYSSAEIFASSERNKLKKISPRLVACPSMKTAGMDISSEMQAQLGDMFYKAFFVPKVGRNDPCPCGSGKKYKNCCGRGN